MLKNLLNRRTTSQDKRRETALIQEYTSLTDRLEQIRTNFDFASEDSEIDALIYEENAVLCRLSSLIHRARDMGVHVDFPDYDRGKQTLPDKK